MSEASGIHIGRYELIELIGEGAMGRVYRAHDTVLQRHVAVKLMSGSIASAPDLRDRFLREARAAAKLQHPNIVTIHDFGDADGNLYIAMELVEGRDLTSIIRSREPLSIHTKIDLMLGLLSGLGYAHGQNVVHRDVKPSNIRLATDGRVKIMDFGIAHLAGAEITSTGIVLGTPEYMAPEQIQGRAVTPATDLFAVGSVLYELLTFKKPFPADNVHAILYKVITENPVPPREIDPEIPEALQDVVAAAMAKDPKHRYANAGEMVTALTAVQRGPRGSEEITTKRMPALVLQGTAWMGALKPRHRAAFLAMGTVFVAAGIWGWSMFGGQSEAATANQAVTPLSQSNINFDSSRAGSDSMRSGGVAQIPPPPLDTTSRKAAPRVPDTLSHATLREELNLPIQALEHALESRQSASLRQVWPKMSDAAATGWQEYFDLRQDMRVAFDVSTRRLTQKSAQIRLIATFNFIRLRKPDFGVDTLEGKLSRDHNGRWRWDEITDPTPIRK